VGTKEKKQSESLKYLCVEEFLGDLLHARALGTALEIGLIDIVAQGGHLSRDDIGRKLQMGALAVDMLVGLLKANHVVEERDGLLKLTGRFAAALKFRDLLELKIEIANYAAHDVLDYFSYLICRPGEFMERSRFCRLFAYDRCFSPSRENYEFTKRWVGIATVLTKYEAQACMDHHDFSRYRRVLDIGGNSGEFVLRLCKEYPDLQATVFDLPLVCDVGAEHIRSEPEAGRIGFTKGNALADPLPRGFDLVTFKSMLHDWPEKQARELIARANECLNPGGTLLIFERGPIEFKEKGPSFSLTPFLLFFHSFRLPGMYEEELRNLGYQDIEVQKIQLEMPFYLVTATKVQ